MVTEHLQITSSISILDDTVVLIDPQNIGEDTSLVIISWLFMEI